MNLFSKGIPVVTVEFPFLFLLKINMSSAAPNQTQKKSERIRLMVKEVTEALLSKTPAVVAGQFPNYQTEFPALFAMILKPDYDRVMLQNMIEIYEKRESGVLTKNQSDEAFGQKGYDIYIAPMTHMMKKKE